MVNLKSVRALTLEEVNARLPLIRRIVADLVLAWHERERVREELGVYRKELEGSGSRELLETIERLREEEESLSRRTEYCKEELLQLEGIVRDPGQGVVDFYSKYEGKPAFLTWRPGDDAIGFWHRIDEETAQRRPITALVRAEPRPPS